MTERTTQTTVRFESPFSLRGFAEKQPAGEYLVDLDEESIDTLNMVAWRRVGAFIHLPAIAVRSASHQMVPFDLAEFDAALASDAAAANNRPTRHQP